MEQQDTTIRSVDGKRWLYAIVGLVVLLFAGFVYGWSVFASPIGADFPGWSKASLSLTFTICMACFCLGGFFAGNLSKKVNIRVNVYIAAALFLCGFFLVSRANSLPMLYVSYGVLCGFGSGFAYNAVMSTMTKWFPDRQGLISGLLLMGFGSSSMILGGVFTAVTPAETGGWRNTFLIMGVVIAVVLVAGSFFFKLPSPGAVPAAKVKAAGDGRDFTPSEMIRTSSFWLFFLWAILVSGVGLAVISQAKPFAAAVGTGVDVGVITLVVGFISICNGLGRLLFGGLFDRFGWRPTMLLVNGTSLLGVLVLVGALLTGQFVLVVVGFIITGIAYGGAPTMCSALIGGFYGQKNYPVNFSIGNMNLLIASFSGTVAGALFDQSGTYTTTLIAIGVCSIVAFALLALIRKPK